MVVLPFVPVTPTSVRRREGWPCHAHLLQQPQGNFPLEPVLGLIVYARLPTPAHKEQTGDAIHLPIEQGCHRIDDIPQAAVLQIDHRGFPCGQMIASRQGHRVALVGGYDVLGRDSVAVIKAVTKGI